MEAAFARQKNLIVALQHTLEAPVEIIETHISWVLLTDGFAYKIKKAVNLGFLDFSTLEKRRHCCEEELRLNRRLVSDLYLAVTAIAGSAEQPVLDGSGPAIEYAVKMRRFPQSCLLDQILLHDKLTPEIVDTIACKIAGFHLHTAVADGASLSGAAEQIHQPTAQNFAQIRPRLQEQSDRSRLDGLERWCEKEYQAHRHSFAIRKAQGFIRECHGDLHLGNMVLLDGEVVPFDCIEFNADLRWIDVISEAAFLSMDMQDRMRPDLARRFINTYLEQNGDYAGLEMWRYYQVYRAMVRAKVACIRAEQVGETGAEHWLQYRRHIELAESFSRRSPPFIAITHGLSGSGKTTLSQALLEAMNLFRIRSDVERKRLYGLKPEARSGTEIADGIYSPAANEHTYRHLAELARSIVLSGYPVVVDAAFLRRRERASFRELAQELGVPFAILDCMAPEHLLRARIERRQRRGRDASEADISVLESQLRNHEPLDSNETAAAISVNTGQNANIQALVQRLKEATSGL
ncbi:MAG: AAA family ATPase [Betaproteobacteria bacterium]|nr:AAA family ATPase [Betaproteobacteria bacterium]